MQSATLGPTPSKVNNLSLASSVDILYNSSKLNSLLAIFLVVSNTRTSLNPSPTSLKSWTLAFESSSGVGNVYSTFPS